MTTVVFGVRTAWSKSAARSFWVMSTRGGSCTATFAVRALAVAGDVDTSVELRARLRRHHLRTARADQGLTEVNAHGRAAGGDLHVPLDRGARPERHRRRRGGQAPGRLREASLESRVLGALWRQRRGDFTSVLRRGGVYCVRLPGSVSGVGDAARSGKGGEEDGAARGRGSERRAGVGPHGEPPGPQGSCRRARRAGHGRSRHPRARAQRVPCSVVTAG